MRFHPQSFSGTWKSDCMEGRVRVREELDVPADAVWDAIQDFGDVKVWFPGAQVVEIQGHGNGAVRRIQVPDGEIYAERCEAHDPATFSFSYALFGGPAPFTGYLATVRLEPLGDARCAITWSCTFDAPADSVDAVCGSLENSYRTVFIRSVRQYFSNSIE